jgi:WD40-like Beta Propeller Repeat
MVARWPAAIATIAVAALAAGAARASADALVYRCGPNVCKAAPDGTAGENTQPAWSPNGKRIAFERGGDIYVAHATGAPRERRVLKGGEQPNWTSAAACKPRRSRVRVVRRGALVTACAPQPGRLTVTLLRGGRRVARRTVTAATGGMVTVRLRRPAGASAGELRARVSLR